MLQKPKQAPRVSPRSKVSGNEIVAITNQQGQVVRVIECETDVATFCKIYNASMRGNSHAIPFTDVKPEQWQKPEPNCYFNLTAFTGEKYRPTSFVQLPSVGVMRGSRQWDFAAVESLIQSREEAFAFAAKCNRDYMETYGTSAWQFVVRVVPPDGEWQAHYTLDGMSGYLDGAYVPFEVVEPTPEELLKYAIPTKARRSGKVGAA